MNLKISYILLLSMVTIHAQEIDFTEYDLDNGMHVILQNNNDVPVVSVGVMYHVGAKDDELGRSGMAHFFEHLLFEGSKNIEKGEFFKLVSLRGGSNNANTTNDRTYYYETFPAGELELGLWLEAERLKHPVIDQEGVATQNRVIKEEKRTRIDNVPYGKIYYGEINQFLFEHHPYKNTVIGSMEDLDNQKLEDFLRFKENWYSPANATLVVTGNYDLSQAKTWIDKYFGSIESKPKPEKVKYTPESPLKKGSHIVYDGNINAPALVINYRFGDVNSKEAYAAKMLSNILSRGKTSRLYSELIEEKGIALNAFSYAQSMEDYGILRIVALPMAGVSLKKLEKQIDKITKALRKELIEDWEHEKVTNQIEKELLHGRQSSQSLAHSLANYHVLHKDTSLINKEMAVFEAFTKEELLSIFDEMLDPKKRVIIHYLIK